MNTLTERTQGVWKEKYNLMQGEWKITDGLSEFAIATIEDKYRDTKINQANAAFICKAVNNFNSIGELLEDLKEYFDNKADADHNGENFVPNEEMKFLSRIEEIEKQIK